VTPEQAAAFVDSLTDEKLTHLLSELMWYQITQRSEQSAPSATELLRGVRILMATKARAALIDRLVTP
jgi:hypothetical protein